VNATRGRPPIRYIREVNYLTTKLPPSARSVPDEAANHHRYTEFHYKINT